MCHVCASCCGSPLQSNFSVDKDSSTTRHHSVPPWDSGYRLDKDKNIHSRKGHYTPGTPDRDDPPQGGSLFFWFFFFLFGHCPDDVMQWGGGVSSPWTQKVLLPECVKNQHVGAKTELLWVRLPVNILDWYMQLLSMKSDADCFVTCCLHGRMCVTRRYEDGLSNNAPWNLKKSWRNPGHWNG